MKKALYLLVLPLLLTSCGLNKNEIHNFVKVDKIDPTCESEGVRFHYHCNHCNKDFTIDADGYYVETPLNELKINALGHDYLNSDVAYVRNGENATATIKCSRQNCNHTESQTKKVSKITNTSTCEESGNFVYTFNFSNEFGGKWEDKEFSSARGHTFNDVSYTWTDDFSSCTASGYCESCFKRVNETVEGEYVVDIQLTDGQPELGHFEANFSKFSATSTPYASFDKYGEEGYKPLSLIIENYPLKTEYLSGDVFENDGLVVYVKFLNGCRALLSKESIQITYQNGGNCFLASDEYITLSYNKLNINLNVVVHKKVNTITGKDFYFIESGKPLDLNDIKTSAGGFSYKILDNNNVEIPENELHCGTYNLLITSSEESEYSSTQKTIPLQVIHHADTNGNCIHCNEKVFGNAFYDLASGTLTYNNSIEETSYITEDPIITDLTGKSYDFSGLIAGSTKPLLFTRGSSAVIVDVSVATRVIKTIEDFRKYLFVQYESKSTSISSIDGLYVLGCDIDATNSKVFETDHSTAIQWAWPTDYGSKGFVGEFDGKGFKISNLILSSNGYGGLFGLIGSGAKIKNLTMENISLPVGQWWKYSSLCYVASSASFENINLSYSSYADYQNNLNQNPQSYTHGILAGYSIEDNCSFKDITINAPGLKLGAALAYRVADSAKFENFNIFCDDVACLGRPITNLNRFINSFPNGVLIRDKEIIGKGSSFISNGLLGYSNIYYINGNQHAQKAADYFYKKIKQYKSAFSPSLNSYEKGQVFKNKDKNIVFCDKEQILNLGFTSSIRFVGDGDYLFVPDENTIYIYAKGEAGFNLGCLDLLEELVGFDSYFDQVNFKEATTIKFSKDAKFGHASFAIRMDDGSGYTTQTDQNYGEGFYSNTPFNFAGSTKGYYHNSYDYLPPETYRTSHSKWFSDKTISSRETSDSSPILYQLCFTAHGDSEEYTNMVKTAGEKLYSEVLNVEGKANTNIMFGIQDNTYTCTCSSCTNFKNSHGGSASAAYVKFANDMIDYVRNDKKCDIEFKLVIFAYHATVTAPTNITLNKDLAVMYAPIEADYQVSIDHSRNAEYKKNIDAWSKLTENLLTWIYCADFSYYLFAHNVFDSMQPTYKYLENCGVKLIYDEDQHNINQNSRTGFSRLKHYLRGKLTRNTNADVASLTNNFFSNYYLEAGPYLKQFYDEWITRNRIQYSTQMNGGGYGYYNGKYVSNYHNVSWRYDLVSWDKTELKKWISYCDSALAAVKKYKTTDLALYNKLVNRIKIETIFPRWVLLCVFNETSYAADFKKDCNDFNITRVSEGDSCPMPGGAGNGLLEWWYNKWGI